ncbi:MAG: sulfite oxidase [Chromatiales bacterium]|nr:sulfite oxidase [Chromatiales bacterium]
MTGHVTRRDLLARGAAAGALVALGTARPAAAQSPAPPAGPVANDAVKASKATVMQWHSERPLTGSVPAHEHDFDVTPTDRMFVRNNLFMPRIDGATHRVTVKGLVDREVTFSIDDLRARFPVVSFAAMLECAGSGRTGFNPVPRGTPWLMTGGMGCPKWTGVRLKDVLAAAGLKDGAAHVAGQGGDFGALPTMAPVIRSIPLAKALEEHTLLAFAMNDAPLEPVHGYPLRLLTPGWVGSASTKWLHTLTVLAEPFQGTYMDDSYRVPRHAVAPGSAMPADSVPTEAWPVKSMITAPAPDERYRVGETITVRGRAWVGEGRVTRVEISSDEGVTWRRAQLAKPGDKYAWRAFSFTFRPRQPGYQTFLARARDDRGNAQPMATAWNPLGYFWNGVHRIGVTVDA